MVRANKRNEALRIESALLTRPLRAAMIVFLMMQDANNA